MEPKLTAAEVAEYLDEIFPLVSEMMTIEDVASMRARLRFHVTEVHLRPGGTVSGPTMFTLADCAFYAATLAMIGRQAQALTTNLNINFLRRPEARDLIGEARILKLGRLLATGEVTLWSDGDDRPVAHATMTYAIPPSAGE